MGQVQQGLEKRLQDLARSYSVGDRVCFLPPVDPGLLIEYMSGADAVIIPLDPQVPNHGACLPNRVFEAVSARQPIIAPANTEMGSFVRDHGIGVTFDSFTPEKIAQAIRDGVGRKKRRRVSSKHFSGGGNLYLGK